MSSVFLKGSLVVPLCALLALSCIAGDGTDVGSSEQGLTAEGARCTIRGRPPVQTGCAQGESCIVEACTNSIPPSCVGHCGTTRFLPPVGVPDAGISAPAGECESDADCRAVADYCHGGCDCVATTARKVPAARRGRGCPDPVACLVDPCIGRTATCEAGRCIVSGSE
jgi:hypothetical protein